VVSGGFPRSSQGRLDSLLLQSTAKDSDLEFTRLVKTSYIYVPMDEIPEFRLSMLKDKLTVRSNFGSPDGIITLFDESKPGWFGIPLYHQEGDGFKSKREVDHRPTGKPFRFLFTPKKEDGSPGGLRPGQVPVITEFEKRLGKGCTGFILEADPGFGKTVTVIKMMQMIGLPTLVVVPRSNLVEQWVQRITRHSSLRKSDIGVVCGDVKMGLSKQIIIGLVHTLALDRLGKEFRTRFGLVVFDEVDRSVPPATFAPVVPLFPAKYRIGCSATVKRRDGLDVVFRKHIGQVHLTGIAGRTEVMKPKAIIVEYRGNSGSVPSHLPKMSRRGILLSKLAKDPARNMLIARMVYRLYKSGRRVVVLSDRVAHLQQLRAMVSNTHDVPFKETGLYVGSVPGRGKLSPRKKMTKTEWDQVAKEAKIIFATYQMFAIGTDIPTLAGLVYATPQSEVIQSKGRIERTVENKQQPVVIDIYDTGYTETMRWAAYRMRQYRESGMEVVRFK
jgi:superfamily II DNA or RNA helicase